MSFAPYLDPAPSPLPSPRLPTLADLDRRRAELLAWRLGATPAQSAAASSDDSQCPDNWPALSPSALYGLAGEVLRVIGPHSEADPAAILLQFLAAFGNLIGPGPHCVVESTHHSLNLFVVLVGESSKARKGTSWGHIRRLIEEVDAEWVNQRVTGGLSSAEGLINEVRDQELATDRRLFALSDEFASVLRVMGRDGNALSPILRSAWDSGNLRTLVKHDPLKATGAHISLVGHITRHELLRYLSDTESHNGFANRLIWTCVRRSKCLPEGGRIPQHELAAVAAEVKRALDWTVSEPEREFQRDPDARQLWAKVYPSLSEGQPDLLGAATSRGEAQVLRLSAIYAALDCSPVVCVPHLRAALGLWKYSYLSARLIFGDATGDPMLDRIRECLDAAGPDGLTRTEISDLFKRNASSERIDQALQKLTSLGLVINRQVPTEGRPIRVWSAVDPRAVSQSV